MKSLYYIPLFFKYQTKTLFFLFFFLFSRIRWRHYILFCFQKIYKQRSVAAAVGQSSNGHGQGQPHSAMNNHGVLSREATVPPFERPNGSELRSDSFLPPTRRHEKETANCLKCLESNCERKLSKKIWIHSQKAYTLTPCVNLVAMRERKSLVLKRLGNRRIEELRAQKN